MIPARAQIVAPLGHRRASGLGPAFYDDASRLPLRVRVDDPNGERQLFSRHAASALRVDLHRLDLGVELARSGALLATPRARSLHASEGRVWIDTRRVAVHTHQPRFNAVDVAQRATHVAR